jgi:hypothetical protein
LTGGLARVTIHIPTTSPSVQSVIVSVGDETVSHQLAVNPDGSASLAFDARLHRSAATVITLYTPYMFRPDQVHHNGDMRRVGVAVGDIVVEPLS